VSTDSAPTATGDFGPDGGRTHGRTVAGIENRREQLLPGGENALQVRLKDEALAPAQSVDPPGEARRSGIGEGRTRPLYGIGWTAVTPKEGYTHLSLTG
jgi:hypothetical protein